MEQKIVLRFMDLANTEESRTNHFFFAARCSDPSEQSFKESLYPPPPPTPMAPPVALDHIQR
jgi:hypothetical protein